MAVPEINHDNEMYHLLREEKIEEFNQRKAAGEAVELRHCDFRGLDLRGMDASGIDFTGSYFRQADLRGIDFSKSVMRECSINSAKISGVYFPPELMPEEISMSLSHGTRMRYRHIVVSRKG